MYLLAFNLLDPVAMALLLALVAALLLVAEVFFPSGGVLGLLSGSAFIASVYYAFQQSSTVGLTFATIEVIALPILVMAAMKIFPKTSMGKAFLGEAPRAEQVAPDDHRHALVGRVGIARSKMLPAGSIEIDGQMIDAISQGQAIDPGQYIKVVEVRGNRVMVRRAETDERPANPNPGDLLTRPVEELGIDGLDLDGDQV